MTLEYDRGDPKRMIQESIERELAFIADLEAHVGRQLDGIASMRADAAECRANVKRLQEALEKLG